MKASIFPNTSGDVILDLRVVLNDGVMRPALVVVNANGSIKPFGKLLEFRDGGGHVEVYRDIIATDLGFERVNEKVQINPEGV